MEGRIFLSLVLSEQTHITFWRYYVDVMATAAAVVTKEERSDGDQSFRTCNFLPKLHKRLRGGMLQP